MMQNKSPAESIEVNNIPPQRIASIDIFRGMVMFLMLFEMVHLDSVSKALVPNSSGGIKAFWETIHFHTTHVAWEGCSLHDLIQPSFSFLVGCAMAFSVKRRLAQGQSTIRLLGHALGRSFILISLGVLLRSLNTDRISFRFDDTLCQIGLGYTFLFLISLLPQTIQYISIPVLLIGYWGAFVLYPLPPEDFDYAAVGVAKDWPHHLTGLEAHWNKNSNLAWAVDRWWMNLFPRNEPFSHSDGGYATLSFIPTLATMLLGLWGGKWLRDDATVARKLILLGSAMISCWAIATVVDGAGGCPIVKRIWTPTWVLWSGGWSFAFLLLFYFIADVMHWKKWAYPWIVIGSNSIAAYVMSYTTAPFFEDRLSAWFSPFWSKLDAYFPHSTPMFVGLVTFVLIWLVLYWLNTKKLYIRI